MNEKSLSEIADELRAHVADESKKLGPVIMSVIEALLALIESVEAPGDAPSLGDVKQDGNENV